MTSYLLENRAHSHFMNLQHSEFLHSISVYSIYNKALLIFEAPSYEARA